MSEYSTSPPRNLLRIPSLKSFLPLQLTSDAPTFSTRGQHLPSLIHQHSSSRTPAPSPARRPSSTRADNERDGYGEDAGNTEGGRFHGLTMPWNWGEQERRQSMGAEVLNTPLMRSQRLIGNSNPRYRWEQYYKSEDELKKMKKPIRKYYERNNFLIQNYLYIDRLLDSSLPHNLIQEYSNTLKVPPTISEEIGSSPTSPDYLSPGTSISNGDPTPKVKRTPKNLYKVPNEQTPLLKPDDPESGIPRIELPDFIPDEETDSSDPIVTLAIYINLAANTTLLIMKIIATILTSSLSVIASLVDAALDFLSTAIVWTTARLISRKDQYSYPVGRRRLEPIGVLVFSVIMVTSFFQVAIEGVSRLTGDDHRIVRLTYPAIGIMASTVVIKLACWFWCRMIRNSSVQALAQDAMTDVVFNIFSIIFPLVGYYAGIWPLDAIGGIILSCYVILNWSRTSITHIRNLTGAASSADERNILLYLTMRFAKTIKQIQGLQAYHAGDKLNVEVDVVLDENTSLMDSHDLGESLQYVLESVPYVDRAFVHLDYRGDNLPSHLEQQE